MSNWEPLKTAAKNIMELFRIEHETGSAIRKGKKLTDICIASLANPVDWLIHQIEKHTVTPSTVWAFTKYHPGVLNQAEGRPGKLTPLHCAILARNESVVKALLKHGANPNARDEYGATALHYEAYEGNPRIANLLMEHGAKTETADNFGWTPLHYAARRGWSIIASNLTLNGANADAITKRSPQWSPLHLAADKGHSQILPVLRRGQNILVLDNFGRTPCQIAEDRIRSLYHIDNSPEKEAILQRYETVADTLYHWEQELRGGKSGDVFPAARRQTDRSNHPKHIL